MLDFEAREIIATAAFEAKEQGEISAVAWVKDDRPLIVLNDGAIRVMDNWLQVWL